MKKSLGGLVVNSFGVIATSLITFITLPLFTKNLGLEEYAVFAIWIVAINFFQFLDLGLSTTLIQETAGKKRGKHTVLITKSFETILICFYILLIPLLLAFELPVSDVYNAITDDAGGYSLLLFTAPIIFNNLIKFYSFGLLSRQEVISYNLFIVVNEFLKQILGFFVYFVSRDWMVFFLYQCFVTFLGYLLIRHYFYSGLSFNKSPSFKFVSIAFNRNFKFTFVIFLSAIAGGFLSSIDRFTLSIMSSSTVIAVYASCFVVASIINMVIQPFHKVSLPIFVDFFKNGKYEELAKEFIFLSSLLSLVSLYLGCFMFIYLELYVVYILPIENYDLAKNIIILLVLGFWLVSCGWLSANVLQAMGLPSVQLSNMLIAILVGGFISIYFINEGYVFAAASIWVIHGVIQSSILPIKLCSKFSFVSLGTWYRKIIIAPIFKVAILFLIVSIINHFFSIYLGVLFFIVWFLLDLYFVFRAKFGSGEELNDKV